MKLGKGFVWEKRTGRLVGVARCPGSTIILKWFIGPPVDSPYENGSQIPFSYAIPYKISKLLLLLLLLLARKNKLMLNLKEQITVKNKNIDNAGFFLLQL